MLGESVKTSSSVQSGLAQALHGVLESGQDGSRTSLTRQLEEIRRAEQVPSYCLLARSFMSFWRVLFLSLV